MASRIWGCWLERFEVPPLEVGLAIEKILHDIAESAWLLQLWHVRPWQSRCSVQTALDQPDRRQLEFQCVPCPWFRFVHFFLLKLIFNRKLWSKYFGGNVMDPFFRSVKI